MSPRTLWNLGPCGLPFQPAFALCWWDQARVQGTSNPDSPSQLRDQEQADLQRHRPPFARL